MNPLAVTRWLGVGLWLGAAAAAALALVGAPVPLPLDAALLAHVSGLLAGYLAAVMLLLMSRTPLLDVYLCASPRLSEAVRAGLREAGLPRRRLHEECFTF